MTDFDRTNTGALFKNDRKQTPNQPDYNGNANIDGTEYWVNAWIKTSKAGKPFMSFSYKPKEQQAPAPEQQVAQPAPADQDIPF